MLILNQVVESCLIMNYFLKVFVLLCTRKPVYVSVCKWWISFWGEEAWQFFSSKNVFPSRYAQLALFWFVLTAVDVSRQLPNFSSSPFLLYIFSTGCWLRLRCQGYSWFQWCRLDRNLSAGKMISFVYNILGHIWDREYVQSFIVKCIYCKWHLMFGFNLCFLGL